jgi:SAM-dependent methyltransferase
MGYQTLEDFDGYLAACDVILNLRQTTFGESSGTMMRAFALGKPVIVSAVGGACELPENTCIPIPRDRHEAGVIVECLKWLLANPDAGAEIGTRAREWIAAECTWDKAAGRYVEFLRKLPTNQEHAGRSTRSREDSSRRVLSQAAVSNYLSRWIDPLSPAGAYFTGHAVRLARTLQLVPPGNRESRILELGCYMQITPALRGLLGYGEVRGAYLGTAGGWHLSTKNSRDGDEFTCTIDLFNCEQDRFPYPEDSFDTVTCCELLEHLERDPMHMMNEIHRILKPNGTLVLTTPNAVSIRALHAVVTGIHPNLFSKYVIPSLLPETKHIREYTPKDLLMLFADAGFTVQFMDTTAYGPRTGVYRLATRAIELLRPLTRLREDCIYVVGQKSKDAGSRYPAWLYEQV